MMVANSFIIFYIAMQLQGVIFKNNLQNAQTRPVCRICIQQSQQKLITPCICSGSVAFVHQSCLIKWLQKNCKTIKMAKNSQCQLCKSKFFVKLVIKRILNCQAVKQKIMLKPKGCIYCGTFTFIIAIILIMLIISLITMGTGSALGNFFVNLFNAQDDTKLIIGLISGVLIILQILLILIWIFQYLLLAQIKIKQIKNRNLKKPEGQIIPQHILQRFERELAIQSGQQTRIGIVRT